MLTVHANERPNGGARVFVQHAFLVYRLNGQPAAPRKVWGRTVATVGEWLASKHFGPCDIAETTETRKRMKRPTMATLSKWSMDSVVRATDGCKVEPDGVCPHGAKSWLLELNMI